MKSFHNKHLHTRHGFTLVEVLVGLTVTLVILVAMTQAFKFASEEMTKGRASVELTNRLRTAESLLRKDLDRLTLEPRSYHSSATEPKGYFEIVDGFATDTNFIGTAIGGTASAGELETSIKSLMVGDYDDLWSGTIRSDSQPFRGRNGLTIQESHLAEVVWFTVPNDLNGDAFVEVSERADLYRRVLLIRPDIVLAAPVDTNGVVVAAGAVAPLTGIASLAAAQLTKQLYLQSSDISVGVQFDAAAGGWEVFPNSLRDLSLRTNRFFAAVHGLISPTANYRLALRNSRSADNQDILINDVLAFDIQVFDPTVTVMVNSDGAIIRSIVSPTDIGNTTFDGTTNFVIGDAANNTPAVLGAYIDLGKTGTANGQFAGAAINLLRFTDQVYDTGTPLYDRNNVNDDPTADGTTPLIDEGGDKIDNDGDGLIDEGIVDANVDGTISAAEIASSEKEVTPNFTAPIRGLQIRIRLMEPTTGQVSQTTVKKSF